MRHILSAAALLACISAPEASAAPQDDCPPQECAPVIDGAWIRLTPHWTRGDRDYSKHGPVIDVAVRLERDDRNVYAVMSMIARETASDHTAASGSYRAPIFTAPPGMRIVGIDSPTAGQLSYVDDDQEVDVFDQNGGLVRRYACVGDTPGDDAGLGTHCTAWLQPVHILMVRR